MSLEVPGPGRRWRCGGCGNLTRFDVVRTRRTSEYWHFDLAGDHRVEETEVRHEVLEQVMCRWCGRCEVVEVVARNDVEPGEPGGMGDVDAAGD